MPNHLLLTKNLGETPLDCIHRFIADHPEYKDIPLGYAGRLDPMAEGLLLVLVGEENKKRKQYELLPKIYEFEVLFGIATDSYDTLGIITHHTDTAATHVSEQKIKTLLSPYVGAQQQPYPPYSAARVKGKPLYWWARADKLNTIDIPTKNITINALTCLSYTSLSSHDVLRISQIKRSQVHGEFRQQEIESSWRHMLTDTSAHYPIAKIHISCSSGTYVRSIAHKLGEKLGTGALAWSIRRMQIGPYMLSSDVSTYITPGV